MTKSELRRHYRAARRAHVETLSDMEIAAAGTAVKRLIERRFALPEIVSGYIGMGAEFDIVPLLADWRAQGHVIALPHFGDREAEMVFHAWRGELETGPFMKIPQPIAEGPEVLPDMLLMPLVAVAPDGARLGQGGGYYDRMLARLRALKPITAVAVAWECQVAESLPTEPWDQPIDAIVTPERLIEVGA